MRSRDILHDMKTIICIALLFATLGWADEAADRSAIERVIAQMNTDQYRSAEKRMTQLFTADADNELDRLSHLSRRLLQAADKPWSEVTTPRMVIQSIRFVTSEVALVDAANTQYGSTILVRNVPMLIVMQKVAAE